MTFEESKRELVVAARAALAELATQRGALEELLRLCRPARNGHEKPAGPAEPATEKPFPPFPARTQIDWSSVLSQLPVRFTVPDVKKVAGPLGVPDQRVYSRLSQMVQTKTIRRYLPGRYEKA